MADLVVGSQQSKMVIFDMLRLAVLSIILYVVCGSVHDMHQDQIDTNTFEVKPGAGRQEFVRQWVCYSLIDCKIVKFILRENSRKVTSSIHYFM